MTQFRMSGVPAWSVTLALLLPCSAGAADLLNQPWDKTSHAIPAKSSQTENHDAVYERFTLTPDTKTVQFDWTGIYLKPLAEGQIRGWTITLYRDDQGRPGKSFFTHHVAGKANETAVTRDKKAPAFRYGIDPIDLPCVCGQPAAPSRRAPPGSASFRIWAIPRRGDGRRAQTVAAPPSGDLWANSRRFRLTWRLPFGAAGS